MKYLDEFRDPALAQRLVREIRRTATRSWAIMEVCGGQTHSLLRHGIEEELQDVVELIHGPGCPVCVTPHQAIDLACRLALNPQVVLTSFGDMLRVPGSCGSLQAAAAAGGTVRPVYSPADAVALAQRNPQREVVFFAIGFETTTPATALAVLPAQQLGLKNFSLLVAHVRVHRRWRPWPATRSLGCRDSWQPATFAQSPAASPMNRSWQSSACRSW